LSNWNGIEETVRGVELDFDGVGKDEVHGYPLRRAIQRVRLEGDDCSNEQNEENENTKSGPEQHSIR